MVIVVVVIVNIAIFRILHIHTKIIMKKKENYVLSNLLKASQ